MKKLLLLSILLLASKVSAMSNRDDFQRWRSSETSTADTYVFIATNGPIVVWDITTTSGTYDVGTSSWVIGVPACTFQYMNSTVTYTNHNLATSSSTIFDMKTTGTRFDLSDILPGTFHYTKTGPCSIRVRWDYYLSPPKGRENIGLKR